MKGNYNIGEVYLLGFSQGCGLSYMAGLKHNDLVEGIMAFGGWLDTEWISEDIFDDAIDTRIFIAHGTADTMVEYVSGTDARDYLIDLGYDVTFYSFDGPHTVPEDAVLAAQEWMNE